MQESAAVSNHKASQRAKKHQTNRTRTISSKTRGWGGVATGSVKSV